MNRARLIAGVVLIALFVAAGVTYVSRRASTPRAAAPAGFQLERDAFLYVAAGRVQQASQAQPDKQLMTGSTCHRVYAAADTLACLRGGSVPMSSQLEISNDDAPHKTLPLWGDPSRVRVSPSGNLVAWTVFRTGDSYLVAGAFSTTAGIYDLRTGAHYGSLEDFTPYVEGKRYESIDVNYWGITFLRDDRTFYATMSSKGRTWLIRGDLPTRRLTALRNNVECPSLSPDETRLAYKFRTGDKWRLHVLDLADGTDRALAEQAHVDDQPAWIDDETVAYSKNEGGKAAIYAVPADGTGAPRRLVTGSSPAFFQASGLTPGG